MKNVVVLKFVVALSFSTAIALSILSGCSDVRDQDPILTGNSASGCDASSCHPSAPLGHYPPVSGKHTLHLYSSSGIRCSNCHSNYSASPIHKNGIINGYNSITDSQAEGDIIFFDNGNAGASWDNSSASCDNMNCHGSISWYSTAQLTCIDCHNPGSSYDPLAQGKHAVHINSDHATIDMDCETCHSGYRNNSMHIDGNLNASMAISFDSSFPGVWDANTNTCSGLVCHGNAAWGVSSELSCTDCHSNSYSVFYPVPNSQGSHYRHIVTESYSCNTCHDNYRNSITHIDGYDDRENESVNLIFFYDPSYELSWDDSHNSCSRSGTGCHYQPGSGWDVKYW